MSSTSVACSLNLKTSRSWRRCLADDDPVIGVMPRSMANRKTACCRVTEWVAATFPTTAEVCTARLFAVSSEYAWKMIPCFRQIDRMSSRQRPISLTFGDAYVRICLKT